MRRQKKTLGGINTNNKKVKFGILVITLAFLIPLTSAAVTYLMRANFSATTAVPDIQFISGADMTAIGGTIGDNGSVFTATTLPLVAGTQVTVDEAVKVKNNAATSKQVQLGIVSESFDGECKAITVYINGEIAVVIDDDGTVTTSVSGYFAMAASAEWIIKIVTEMDPDAPATAETLVLALTWT